MFVILLVLSLLQRGYAEAAQSQQDDVPSARKSQISSDTIAEKNGLRVKFTGTMGQIMETHTEVLRCVVTYPSEEEVPSEHMGGTDGHTTKGWLESSTTEEALTSFSDELTENFNNETDIVIIERDGIFLATNKGIYPDAPENIKVAWIAYDVGLNGTYELLVSITNISRHDKGIYTCKVLRSLNENDTNTPAYQLLAQKFVHVDVLFRPSGKPSCEVLRKASQLTAKVME